MRQVWKAPRESWQTQKITASGLQKRFRGAAYMLSPDLTGKHAKIKTMQLIFYSRKWCHRSLLTDHTVTLVHVSLLFLPAFGTIAAFPHVNTQQIAQLLTTTYTQLPLFCNIMSLLCRLTLSQMVMVTLYKIISLLLSGCSALATSEAAENVQGAGLFWCTCSSKPWSTFDRLWSKSCDLKFFLFCSLAYLC